MCALIDRPLVLVNECYQLLCPTCVTPSVRPSVRPSRNSCSRQKPTSCHETQPQISLCHETQEGPSICHETQEGPSTGHETQVTKHKRGGPVTKLKTVTKLKRGRAPVTKFKGGRGPRCGQALGWARLSFHVSATFLSFFRTSTPQLSQKFRKSFSHRPRCAPKVRY